VTEKVLLYMADVVPDADGIVTLKHGLGTEDVSVRVLYSTDPAADVGIVTPIDADECEAVLTTTAACQVVVSPLEAAVEVLDPAEETRRRRYGS
jgi:hypothetical protein